MQLERKDITGDVKMEGRRGSVTGSGSEPSIFPLFSLCNPLPVSVCVYQMTADQIIQSVTRVSLIATSKCNQVSVRVWKLDL